MKRARNENHVVVFSALLAGNGCKRMKIQSIATIMIAVVTTSGMTAQETPRQRDAARAFTMLR
ncbi:hypothetical protein SH528x_003574 [Novipirellula sp. SH528]|uniref:hypothetical protein n=1 Tax=Novipirellula sp. SH528 TaxID=3454466 RepID=UPI003F9F8691